MTGAAALAMQFLVLLVELLVLLFAVSALLALGVRRAGLARLQRWLGGSRLAGTVKGMGLGFVIPFCTYSAIPAFVGMIDARVRTATLAGFLAAAPLLDPLVVTVLLLLFGWQATLAYVAVTAALVFVLANVADLAHAERMLRPARRPATLRAGAEVSAGADRERGVDSHCGPDPDCRPDPYSDGRPWRGLRDEAATAATYAVTLVRGLLLPMVLAVTLAAAILGFVPEQLLARVAGPGNPLAVPAAALLGVPFYVSTESFLPIASALHANGMGVGAVFALVISAAGVNLPELTLLGRLMTPRLLVTYVAAIVGVAVAVGYLIPLLL